MDIIQPDSMDTDNLRELIIQHGIFKIDSFLTDKEIESLKKEVLDHHLKKGQSYPFGSAYAIKDPNSLPTNSDQKKIFSKPWMKELFLSYNKGVYKGFFDSIYSTHDFIYDGTLGRNGYLHFDRKASLKFFFYLNDVTAENGAFYIQPNSHILGRELRKKAWGKFLPKPNNSFFRKGLVKFFGKKFKDVKNRVELDYPNLYNADKLIPVEGKAGTLIVFDSDIFHRGGIIGNKGMERIILRMHSYLS